MHCWRVNNIWGLLTPSVRVYFSVFSSFSLCSGEEKTCGTIVASFLLAYYVLEDDARFAAPSFSHKLSLSFFYAGCYGRLCISPELDWLLITFVFFCCLSSYPVAEVSGVRDGLSRSTRGCVVPSRNTKNNIWMACSPETGPKCNTNISDSLPYMWAHQCPDIPAFLEILES